MRKLIVGCGYLGRRAAEAWLRDGHEVYALTRGGPNAEALRAAGIEPIVGDVTDPATLAALPAADTLLYAVGFDRSAGHAQRAVYVDGLRNVLAEVRQRSGRLIYVSSSSVYGQQQGEWVDETSPTVPATSSGEVCLAAEQVVWEFFPPDKPPARHDAVILRLSGLYGPGRLLRRMDAVKSGTPIAGDPRGWLNLVHVDDAVGAVRAADVWPTAGTTCLVSDDRPVTRGEYFTQLARLAGADPPLFDASQPTRGPAGSLGKRCRNRKLREELGVELQYPTIDEGLPHAVGRC